MTALTFDYRNTTAHPLRLRRHRAHIEPLDSAAVKPSAGRIESPNRWRALPLVLAIAGLHIAAVGVFSHGHAGRVSPAVKPVEIAIIPLKKVEPPAPPPKHETPTPRPKTVAAKHVAAPTPVQPSHYLPVVSEPTAASASADTAQVATTPVVKPAAPAPVPPEEKISEPRGYAGYLKNPAPDYPPAAQKRGMEGQVLLKVHVQASGEPDSVTVAKSSGYAVLDDSAVKAVLKWVFEPARRGTTPIDGWVQVPLNFKI